LVALVNMDIMRVGGKEKEGRKEGGEPASTAW
jgi:hypothetical protein